MFESKVALQTATTFHHFFSMANTFQHCGKVLSIMTSQYLFVTGNDSQSIIERLHNCTTIAGPGMASMWRNVLAM
jgi:hypothetical protein